MNGVTLVDLKDFVTDRQCELDVTLEPGSYIILPRTSGCTLRRPQDAIEEEIKLMHPQGHFHELFDSTINVLQSIRLTLCVCRISLENLTC